MFKKLLNPDTRNTLMTDMLSLLPLDGEEEDGNDNDTLPWDENTTKPISQDLCSALRESVGFTPSKARSLSHLTIGGLTYSVTSKHAGNSNILFKPHPDSPAIPSQIDYVLQFHVNETLRTFIAIRRHIRLQVEGDPFCHFPILQTQMWSRRLGPIEILEPDEILSHFAKADVTWEGVEVVVVASLSRASCPCGILIHRF
jgi:hypothetical protein